MSELSSGTKGALAELRVAAHLITLGFEVARMLNAPILLLEIPEEMESHNIEVPETLVPKDSWMRRVSMKDYLEILTAEQRKALLALS